MRAMSYSNSGHHGLRARTGCTNDWESTQGEWGRLIDEKMEATGKDRAHAAMAVARENPTLRQQLLDEANADRERRR